MAGKVTLDRSKLDALRAQAAQKSKEVKTKSNEEVLPKKKGATEAKPAAPKTEEQKALESAEIPCALCNNKQKKQRWFGEHLVNTHNITLVDYIRAFTQPIPEYADVMDGVYNPDQTATATPEVKTDVVVQADTSQGTTQGESEQGSSTVEVSEDAGQTQSDTTTNESSTSEPEDSNEELISAADPEETEILTPTSPEVESLLSDLDEI